MKKPVYKHSSLAYFISALLSIPLLIDICTACHLFPLWLAWFLFTLICIVSCFRLWFAVRQHCYKFAWGLFLQLLLGGGVLTFFQLSYTNVIETPVSHPLTPAVVDIAPPVIEGIDSVGKKPSDDRDKSSHGSRKKGEDSKSYDRNREKTAR